MRSPTRRAEVAVRAGHRCEYCHLSSRGQVATFPIDHIVPRNRGGTNEVANLALTCPHCNAHKWTAVEGTDPQTGELVPLFHPRVESWNDHFAWSDEHRGVVVGRTATARATIAILQMNAANMIEIRQLLSQLGLFEEMTGPDPFV